MMQVPTTYLTSTKNLEAILEAVRRAAEPNRFTYEFLKQLGFSSSSDRPLVPLFKAMRLLDDSGAPTERYRRFRDPSQSAVVLAEALREAYPGVFAINQQAHQLSPQELKGIFARLTGKHEGVVEKMAMTFKALAVRGDFEGTSDRAAAEVNATATQAIDDGTRLPSEVHPLILGLLRELPPPGERFSQKRQRDWLEIAHATFRLIYPEDDDVLVADPVPTETAGDQPALRRGNGRANVE